MGLSSNDIRIVCKDSHEGPLSTDPVLDLVDHKHRCECDILNTAPESVLLCTRMLCIRLLRAAY